MTQLAPEALGAEATRTDTPTETSRDFAEVEAELARLPFWRRPRKLRRQLARTLVGVALLSVLLVGALNIFAALNLLNDGTENQLTGIGQSRALSIERGVNRTLTQTSATASDLGVATALSDLADAFDEAGTGVLDDAQLDELREWYETQVVAPLAARGIDASVDQLMPDTEAGRYLQYQYTIGGLDDPEQRAAVDDAGDGSRYSAVHAQHHPFLSELSDALLADDILLVSADTGEVVYSNQKRIDFGTDLLDGPYADSQLAITMGDRLRRERIGDSLMADFEIYYPGGGKPVAFFVAAIRADTELVGWLGVELSVDALDQISTAGRDWDAVGLGNGESYVVGGDHLLRSTPREWLEDPDSFLARTDDESAEAIERFDTPVLAQSVMTEPVEVALDGEEFSGTSTNVLGTDTFAYAAPIELPGVEWVMVAEVPLSDARAPLFDYGIRMLLVVTLIIPIAALLGWWLARRTTRPVRPVVEAATAVAAGERHPDLPDLGNDEISDLGRRLKLFAGVLERQEDELEREFDDTRNLLLSVLPPRLVQATGELTDDGTAVDHATAIAITVDAAGHDSDEQLGDLLGGIGDAIERLSVEYGLERVRTAADQSLYLAGMAEPSSGATEALRFATALVGEIARARRADGHEVSVQVGLSTGPVATGVLHSGAMTYSAWGEPVRRALAIMALAQPDEVLLDGSTTAEATGRDADARGDDEGGAGGDRDGKPFRFEGAAHVVGIDGESMGLDRLVI